MRARCSRWAGKDKARRRQPRWPIFGKLPSSSVVQVLSVRKRAVPLTYVSVECVATWQPHDTICHRLDGECKVRAYLSWSRPSHPHSICSNCNALYQVVKVETGPDTVDRGITCRCCEAPLIGREANLVIKYFLLAAGGGTCPEVGTRQRNQVKAKTAAAVIEGVS